MTEQARKLVPVSRTLYPSHAKSMRYSREHVKELLCVHHILEKLGVVDGENTLMHLLFTKYIHYFETYQVGDVYTYVLHGYGDFWQYQLE